MLDDVPLLLPCGSFSVVGLVVVCLTEHSAIDAAGVFDFAEAEADETDL